MDWSRNLPGCPASFRAVSSLRLRWDVIYPLLPKFWRSLQQKTTQGLRIGEAGQTRQVWQGAIRLAYNRGTAFQRLCFPEAWQHLMLSKLRYKLFLLPGELTRPQNRPVLRLRESSMLQNLADDILHCINQLHPLLL